MEYPRGTIVKGPDVIGPHQARPWMVVSDDDHPFSSEECLVVAVTTTEREIAIELSEGTFESGSLPEQSYASPWVVTTLKTASIQSTLATLSEDVVTEIAGEIGSYVGLDVDSSTTGPSPQ